MNAWLHFFLDIAGTIAIAYLVGKASARLVGWCIGKLQRKQRDMEQVRLIAQRYADEEEQ